MRRSATDKIQHCERDAYHVGKKFHLQHERLIVRCTVIDVWRNFRGRCRFFGGPMLGSQTTAVAAHQFKRKTTKQWHAAAAVGFLVGSGKLLKRLVVQNVNNANVPRLRRARFAIQRIHNMVTDI